MNRRNFALILILIFSSLNISYAGETGFDEICKIYTEVKNSNMTKEVGSKERINLLPGISALRDLSLQSFNEF